MFTSEMALARYEAACETNEGWREAADLLAEALRQAPPKTTRKAKASPDLYTPIKIGRRAKRWGEFTVTWADGSETLVKGVCFDREADRWPAAFQAADRLRRMRGRHAAWAEIGAPPRWTTGPLGIVRQTQEYERYCAERPLPGPTKITTAEGEVFHV